MAATLTAGQLRVPVFVQVQDLRPDQRGINLRARVVAVNAVVSPVSGAALTADVLLGDSTGTVLCTALHDEQLAVCQSGTAVVVRNAYIGMFAGYLRLVVDRWGTVKEDFSDDAITLDHKINTANNVSMVEYELMPEAAAS